MKHAATQSLYHYWNELRGARAAPERSDVDPGAIRRVLADTFLIEVDNAGGSRDRNLAIRLSGTRFNALFGEELKGRNFLSLWSPAERESVADLVNTVLDASSAAVGGAMGAPLGYPPLGLELLLLPLRHQGKTHARLLGSLVPAEIPPWLGLVPTEPMRLVTERMLRDATHRQAGRSASFDSVELAASKPFAAPVRRDHLLVYDGGLGKTAATLR